MSTMIATYIGKIRNYLECSQVASLPVGGRAHRDPLPASRRQGPHAVCSRNIDRARREARESSVSATADQSCSDRATAAEQERGNARTTERA